MPLALLKVVTVADWALVLRALRPSEGTVDLKVELLPAAQTAAAQVRADGAAFDAAFDAGEFEIGPVVTPKPAKPKR